MVDYEAPNYYCVNDTWPPSFTCVNDIEMAANRLSLWLGNYDYLIRRSFLYYEKGTWDMSALT